MYILYRLYCNDSYAQQQVHSTTTLFYRNCVFIKKVTMELISPDSVRVIRVLFFNHLCPPPHLHASHTDRATPENTPVEKKKLHSFIQASSRLQSEHEQIKVIAEQILKYTETKYRISANESYVTLFLHAHSVHSIVHRWKYSLKRGNKGYLYSTSIAVGVIISKCTKWDLFMFWRSVGIRGHCSKVLTMDWTIIILFLVMLHHVRHSNSYIVW